jgi:beta-fructofuranosidase
MSRNEGSDSMLRLQDRWVWDLWLARTPGDYHMFFLQAPRILGDPELRHMNASVGHAVSADLSSWTILPDALVPGPSAWDDLAIWTGSVIERDGLWYMFYTGVSSADGGRVQRIGLATSSDLTTWTKHPANPMMAADSRWYEVLDPMARHGYVWRDPWAIRDPNGVGFHALIAARTLSGPADARGVIGHATSDDLISWVIAPPLSEPSVFAIVEVPQVELVNGVTVLVFSVRATDISEGHPSRSGPNATYVCPTPALLGPFDPAAAKAVIVPSLYSGRLAQQRDGSWVMLGFLDIDGDGRFVGEIADPIPVESLGIAGIGWT